MTANDFVALLAVKTGILSVAVLLCWIVLRILPVRSPGLHRAVWGGAILLGALGAGFPLTLSVPIESVSYIPPVITETVPPPRETPAAPVVIALPAVSRSGTANAESIPIRSDKPNISERIMPPLPSLSFSLLVAWLAGLAFFLLRRFLQYRSLSTQLADAVPVQGKDLDQWYSILNEYGIPSEKLSFLISREIGPALIRTSRGPAIVVPKNLWEEAMPEIKDGILRHELAHYWQRDLAVCGVMRFLALLHWFNPLARLAVAKFEEATEWACDVAAFGRHEQGERRFAEAMLAIHEAAPNMILQRFAFGGGRLTKRAKLLRNSIKHPKESVMKKLVIVSVAAILFIAGAVHVRFVAQDITVPHSIAGRHTHAMTEQFDPAITNSDNPTMTLTVFDPDDKPIAGATGLTHRFDRDKGRIFKRFTTDENGQAVFELPKKSNVGTFTVSVRTPNYTPFHARWEMEKKPGDLPAACFVKLEKARTIGGIIKNEDGQPVAGVKVEFSFPLGRHTNADSHMGSGSSATTDADGRWTYASLPEDESDLGYGLDLLHADYLPTRDGNAGVSQMLPDGEGNFNYVSIIRRGLHFGGVVKDSSGKPIGGAKVEIEFRDVDGGQGQRYRQTTADAEGHFLFDNCPVSKRTVVVGWAAGFAAQYLETTVTVDAKPVELVLPPEKPVRLKFVDTKGNPIRTASASIRHWGPLGGYTPILSQMLRNEKNWSAQLVLPVDDDGVWTWSEAPIGSMQMNITAPGFMGRTISVEGGGEPTTVTLTLALQIAGKVVDDATGKKIPKFAVIEGLVFNRPGPTGEANLRPNWQTQRTSWERDGAFTCRFESPEHERMIRVEADGYHPSDSRRIKNDEGTIELEFRLKRLSDKELARQEKARTGRTGRVVGPDGKPAAYATIIYATNSPSGGIGLSMHHLEGHAHKSTKADKDGRFTLPPIELDGSKNERYAFVVIHDSGFIRIEQDDFEKTYNLAAKSGAAAIRLEPWAEFEAKVMIGTKPAADADVDFDLSEAMRNDRSKPRIGMTFFAKTDAHGRVVIKRVAPGRYRFARTQSVEQGGGMSTRYPIESTLVDLKPGEKKIINLGDKGRPVIGRIETTPELKKLLEQGDQRVSIHAVLPPMPNIEPPKLPDDLQAEWEKIQAEAEKLQNEPEKLQALRENGLKKVLAFAEDWQKNSPSMKEQEKWQEKNLEVMNSGYMGMIDKDGRFRVDDVPAGDWTFRVDLYTGPMMQHAGAATPKNFTIPEIPGGRSDEAFDLGTIEVLIAR